VSGEVIITGNIEPLELLGRGDWDPVMKMQP